FIMRLRPVTYNVDKSKLSKKFNNTDGGVSYKVETGFIAQEVEKAARDSAFEFDAVNPPQNKDDYYTLSYAKMVVPLTKAVQELQLLIDRQNEKIVSLEAEVETLKNHNGRSMNAHVKNTTASPD
ncbi:MAG: tail fiber domain-containing protein, partial [Cytophagales bacterium]|nr:tail fiber domain-containing protein [Cytophagales bacterium]